MIKLKTYMCNLLYSHIYVSFFLYVFLFRILYIVYEEMAFCVFEISKHNLKLLNLYLVSLRLWKLSHIHLTLLVLSVCPGHHYGPPLGGVWWSGRRPLDREHEHRAGRQQDAVSGQQRENQVHPLHTHVVWGSGLSSCLPCHCQQVTVGYQTTTTVKIEQYWNNSIPK